MSEFTPEEERFQWLHEMQVLIGIGFAEEQAVTLVCSRKGLSQNPSFTKSLLAEYAQARVQQRSMPRLSAWAIPSILAKYPVSEDAAIERRRSEILHACAGAVKPEGLKPRTPPRAT
ncbi:MAG: hypothetical protein ACO376_05970 [Gammaproteobacteria bacterium]